MEENETRFLFLGNLLCLDFINTEIIAEGERRSLIHNFADLEAWLREAGEISKADLAAITVSWNREDKKQFLHQALAFRETLRQMAEQITTGQVVSDEVIAAINHWLKQQKGYPVLFRTEAGYRMSVHYEQGAGRLLAPVAQSASNLLVAADLARVRKCENPQCILYFYDTSKNHARRWCSMGLCGNRFKAAAHYRRSRQK
jgi:predicted RNA-binding Zn ribbon-like protein